MSSLRRSRHTASLWTRRQCTRRASSSRTPSRPSLWMRCSRSTARTGLTTRSRLSSRHGRLGRGGCALWRCSTSALLMRLAPLRQSVRRETLFSFPFPRGVFPFKFSVNAKRSSDHQARLSTRKKHRQKWTQLENGVCLFFAGAEQLSGANNMTDELSRRKRSFPSHFFIPKTIIQPGQARDYLRTGSRNSQLGTLCVLIILILLTGALTCLVGMDCPQRQPGEETALFEPFMYKPRSFYQDRLGTT